MSRASISHSAFPPFFFVLSLFLPTVIGAPLPKGGGGGGGGGHGGGGSGSHSSPGGGSAGGGSSGGSSKVGKLYTYQVILIVIFGLLALCLVCLAVWCVVKSKFRKQKKNTPQSKGYEGMDEDGNEWDHNVNESQRDMERDYSYRGAKAVVSESESEVGSFVKQKSVDETVVSEKKSWKDRFTGMRTKTSSNPAEDEEKKKLVS